MAPGKLKHQIELGNLQHVSSNNLKYIAGLDVLRAFAVGFVIITHWGPHSLKSPPLDFILKYLIPNGEFGVDLFFVLSGFLITRILIYYKENFPQRKKEILKNFYIKRILRIFPLYYLAVLIAYILKDEGVRNYPFYYLTYTSNLLFFKPNALQILTHTWSLSVEEQFYLIWPFIILYTPLKHLDKVILFCLLIGVAGSLIFTGLYGNSSKYLLIPCFIAFSIGGLLALSEFDIKNGKSIVKALKIAMPICAILFICSQFGYRFQLIRLINSVISVNLILYVITRKYNWVTSKIFSNKVFISLGKISYGIYIIHFILPIFWIRLINFSQSYINISENTKRFLIYPPSGYLIELILLLALSYISYYYFEVKFLKLKQNFIIKKPSPELGND